MLMEKAKMDNIENYEKLAKSIVQYLKDHKVIHENRCQMVFGPFMNEIRLERYVREAIFEFTRKAKQIFVENLRGMEK
jgi:hypothetical protein